MIKRLLLATFILIFAISCSDDTASNPVEDTTITPIYEVEYSDNTIIKKENDQ